jgi:hypothetical protein
MAIFKSGINEQTMGFFFVQFCDIAKLAIVDKKI